MNQPRPTWRRSPLAAALFCAAAAMPLHAFAGSSHGFKAAPIQGYVDVVPTAAEPHAHQHHLHHKLGHEPGAPLKFDPVQRVPEDDPAQRPKTRLHGDVLDAEDGHADVQASAKSQAKADSCNGRLPEFYTVTGPALVQLLNSVSRDCTIDLFSLSSTNARAAFAEPNMLTVAGALQADAATYPGNNTISTLQKILYLRAALYSRAVSYSPAVKAAIRDALDAYFASPRVGDITDANAYVVQEALLLISNAGEYLRYLHVLNAVFTRYTADWNSSSRLRAVVLNAQRVLYDASATQNAEFRTGVLTRTDLPEALYAMFANNRAQIGGRYVYLLNNNARELGRLLQYSGAVGEATRAKIKAMFAEVQMTGPSASIWLELVGMADYYDRANCSAYGICNFRETLAAAVLPVKHDCSPSVRVRAQKLTPAQLTTACLSLAGTANHFHYRLKTGNKPIPGDVNETLELVVFHSNADYVQYSGVLYGNSTDNGGMYLEGRSTRPGNQARFIAYEADWLRPDFKIWNLEHEFTHYLDGRFDMKGDYADSLAATTTWWTEGLAEYMALRDTNPKAISVQLTRNLKLSEILQTPTWPWDVDRVYRGGYLGVRFMFERHRDDVETILGFFRAGDYAGYAVWQNTLGTRYDAEFADWFARLRENNTATALTAEVPVNVPDTRQSMQRAYYLDVPPGTATLNFSLSGGSGEADLYARHLNVAMTSTFDHYSWHAGNSEAITVKRPLPGRWYVSAFGREAFSGATLVAKLTPVPVCTGRVEPELPNGCIVAGVAGETRKFSILVPRNARNLRIETFGGSGDVDLYVGEGFEPTASNFTALSNRAGNQERVEFQYPFGNKRYHVTLQPKSPFADVSIMASWDQN